MYGYTRCPNQECNKMLFEEDIEEVDDKEVRCKYCGEKIEMRNLKWQYRIMEHR